VTSDAAVAGTVLSLTHTAPTITLNDSNDDADGTANVLFQSAGAYDITATIQTDVGGTPTTMITLDGVNSDLVLAPPDDIMLDPGGDVINFVSTTETMSLTNGSNLWTFDSAGDTFVFNDAVDVNGAFTAGTVTSDAGVSGTTITGTGKISTTVTTEQLRLSYAADDYITVTVAADGHTTFTTVDNDAAEADINFSPDGNVGIKTAAPSVELDVTGAIKASGTISAATYASDGSVTDAELKYINTLSSNAQTQITNNAALVDTDDEIIAIINASPSTYVDVAAGGTGVGTLTDGGIVTGNGTSDVNVMAVLADAELLVGDGTTEPTVVVPVMTEFIPVGWMIDGASAPGALTEEDNIAYRDFAGDGTEDLQFMWHAPFNISGTEIKVQVVQLVTNGTAPADTEGVSWNISGCSITGDESHDCSPGGDIEVEDTDLDDHADTQWDVFYSGSEAVDDPDTANGWVAFSPTGLDNGELVMIEIERDHDDTNDDYEQDVGLVGIVIKYKIDFATQTY